MNLDSSGDAGAKFAHWHGWLTPAQSGDYTLGAPGGATACYLDGKLLIDRPHAGTAQPGFADCI